MSPSLAWHGPCALSWSLIFYICPHSLSPLPTPTQGVKSQFWRTPICPQWLPTEGDLIPDLEAAINVQCLLLQLDTHQSAKELMLLNCGAGEDS